MERALEIFLEEYLTWKSVVSEKLTNAKADFAKLKKQAETSGMCKELKSALFMCQHELSTTAYLFLESYLRVNNAYSFYDEEQQKEIDSYKTISKKVGQFINEVNEYREDFVNPADITTGF